MKPSKRQSTRISAYGLIVKEQKILLCRLSQRIRNHAGYWTLPGGGLDFAEDPEAAMIREVKEETGLTVRSQGVAGIDSFHEENEQGAFHGIRIIYHTDTTAGKLRYETDGSTDFCAWWSLDETNQLPLVGLTSVGLELAHPKLS